MKKNAWKLRLRAQRVHKQACLPQRRRPSPRRSRRSRGLRRRMATWHTFFGRGHDFYAARSGRRSGRCHGRDESRARTSTDMLRRTATGPEFWRTNWYDLQAAPSWRCASLRACPPSKEGGLGCEPFTLNLMTLPSKRGASGSCVHQLLDLMTLPSERVAI